MMEGALIDKEGERPETFGMELIAWRYEDQRHEDQFRPPVELLDKSAHMIHRLRSDRSSARRLFEERRRGEGLMYLASAFVVAHDLGAEGADLRSPSHENERFHEIERSVCRLVGHAQLLACSLRRA